MTIINYSWFKYFAYKGFLELTVGFSKSLKLKRQLHRIKNAVFAFKMLRF